MGVVDGDVATKPLSISVCECQCSVFLCTLFVVQGHFSLANSLPKRDFKQLSGGEFKPKKLSMRTAPASWNFIAGSFKIAFFAKAGQTVATCQTPSLFRRKLSLLKSEVSVAHSQQSSCGSFGMITEVETVV